MQRSVFSAAKQPRHSIKSATQTTSAIRGTEFMEDLPGSLWLDVGSPDYLAPLLGFVGNEFPEVGRRA